MAETVHIKALPRFPFARDTKRDTRETPNETSGENVRLSETAPKARALPQKTLGLPSPGSWKSKWRQNFDSKIFAVGTHVRRPIFAGRCSAGAKGRKTFPWFRGGYSRQRASLQEHFLAEKYL